MANIKSAKKRARQADKHRSHNVALRSRMRTAVKTVRKALDAKDIELAKTTFASTVAILDNSADKYLIHKNKAARLKSRLNKQLKELVLAQ